ncbi:DnaJ family domain-containing protein [Lentibacillus sediminis]|uniref:DnaJ family domain-containing protein n=1 Tax=Lentibacillus sediminis TaxID=1940529 RepID=UPI001959F0A0|nr:DnaJ family domain-containing protein [Lentibacillus sediminis]
MLGVNKGQVRLSEHSDTWDEQFAREKALLEEIIGEHVVDIQHFGSTAIKGISAKPIIDVLIGVDSLDRVKQFDRKKLREVNIYQLKVKLDGKVVFAKISDMENISKTHIYHVVEHEGDLWKKHVHFRDYLNEHPEAATEYEALKQELAEKYAEDESSYTDAKKAFVDQILEKGWGRVTDKKQEEYEIEERLAYTDHMSDIIKRAEEKGQFDHLPGKGKPLKFEQRYFNPAEKQLYKTLKDNHILPRWVELSNQIEKLKEELSSLEGKIRRKKVKEINKLIKEYNMACPPSLQKNKVEE